MKVKQCFNVDCFFCSYPASPTVKMAQPSKKGHIGSHLEANLNETAILIGSNVYTSNYGGGASSMPDEIQISSRWHFLAYAAPFMIECLQKCYHRNMIALEVFL